MTAEDNPANPAEGSDEPSAGEPAAPEPADAAGRGRGEGAGEGAGEGTEGPEVPDLAAADELVVTQMELAERTADLQRAQAEFLNYKRRVERDRELVAQNVAYKVLTPVIEVLDTIDRAREHAPLEGGLKAVADQLERVVGAQGLVRFGEAGDAFDPNLHEALSHLGEDPEVEVQTVKVVAKAGYRMGDRVVRAAQVLVVDPA